MYRKRNELSVYGVVTDATPTKLILSGWRCIDGERYYTGLWEEPRTGKIWTIAQAAAILRARETRSNPTFRIF